MDINYFYERFGKIVGDTIKELAGYRNLFIDDINPSLKDISDILINKSDTDDIKIGVKLRDLYESINNKLNGITPIVTEPTIFFNARYENGGIKHKWLSSYNCGILVANISNEDCFFILTEQDGLQKIQISKDFSLVENTEPTYNAQYIATDEGFIIRYNGYNIICNKDGYILSDNIGPALVAEIFGDPDHTTKPGIEERLNVYLKLNKDFGFGETIYYGDGLQLFYLSVATPDNDYPTDHYTIWWNIEYTFSEQDAIVHGDYTLSSNSPTGFNNVPTKFYADLTYSN